MTDLNTAGVTVEADSNLTVREDGRTSIQYLVKLDTEPTGSVYITATAPDADADYETVTVSHAIDAGRTTADEYDEVSIAGVTVSVIDAQTPADYDLGNNRLLEIATREHLNAIRWDQNGDGEADDAANAAAYARAFPRIMQGRCDGDTDSATTPQCDPGDCTGYAVANNIRLSDSWTPIGGFGATLKGNGRKVTRLRISRANDDQPVGMFAYNSGTLQNLGLESINVRGDGSVGVLVGRNGGTITGVWSTGRVTGHGHAGGLVGWNDGGGQIINSYAAGRVTGEFTAGGLVGRQTATATGRYWDTEATGRDKGAGQGNPGGIEGPDHQANAGADRRSHRPGRGHLELRGRLLPPLARRKSRLPSGDGADGAEPGVRQSVRQRRLHLGRGRRGPGRQRARFLHPGALRL